MMLHSVRLAFLALALTSYADGTNQSPVVTRSASGQFTAYASNPLLSSGLCAFGEKIEREWRRQLELPDIWRNLIVFVVRDRSAGMLDAPAIASQTFQIDERLKCQITCVVPPPPDDATLAAAVVEALCADFADRDQPHPRGVKSTLVPVPLWLSEGLAQSIVGQPDERLALIRRSATGERPPRGLEIMETMALPADAAGRAVYRAQAALLTESLLRLPDGPRKMRELLTQLGALKHFGRAFAVVYAEDLPDEATLEKWWSLQLAYRADSNTAEPLTAAETSRQLDALLQFGNEIQFDDLWRTSPKSKPVLQERLAGLEALRLRAHPLYRLAIEKYADALRERLKSEPARFRRAARAAGQLRENVEQQFRQIREELDRAERLYASADETAFEEVFRTLDRQEQFRRQRRDPIRDYLDQFDK